MARCSAPVAPRAATLALGLLAQLTGIAAYSTEESAVGDAQQRPIPEQTVATVHHPNPTNVKPLWLPMTRSDWDSIVSRVRLTATDRTAASMVNWRRSRSRLRPSCCR